MESITSGCTSTASCDTTRATSPCSVTSSTSASRPFLESAPPSVVTVSGGPIRRGGASAGGGRRSAWLLRRRVRTPQRSEASGPARQTGWPLLPRLPMPRRDAAGLRLFEPWGLARARRLKPPPARPPACPERPTRLEGLARRGNPGTRPRWDSVMGSRTAEARGRDRSSRPGQHPRGRQVPWSPAPRPQASRRAASSGLGGERRTPASCGAGAPMRRHLPEPAPGLAETALPEAWTATEQSVLPAHRRTRPVDRRRAVRTGRGGAGRR